MWCSWNCQNRYTIPNTHTQQSNQNRKFVWEEERRDRERETKRKQIQISILWVTTTVVSVRASSENQHWFLLRNLNRLNNFKSNATNTDNFNSTETSTIAGNILFSLNNNSQPNNEYKSAIMRKRHKQYDWHSAAKRKVKREKKNINLTETARGRDGKNSVSFHCFCITQSIKREGKKKQNYTIYVYKYEKICVYF